jgi:hypothetical protein
MVFCKSFIMASAITVKRYASAQERRREDERRRRRAERAARISGRKFHLEQRKRWWLDDIKAEMSLCDDFKAKKLKHLARQGQLNKLKTSR